MIEVSGVRVLRGDRAVLSDVSLTADGGQITAVLGPNGSGKTTLLAAITGDLPVAAGRIAINGADVASLSPREAARRRSVMTQSHTVAFGFSVAEVVAMGRAPWRGHPDADHDDARVAAAVVAADLTALLDRPVQALSGGEQARVAFARMLAQHTDVVVLDEPVAALDLAHQEQTMVTLRERARAGATVLVVLHDLTLAARYADAGVVLAEGAVVAAGPVAEVIRPEVLAPVYRVPLTLLRHPVTGAPVVLPN